MQRDYRIQPNPSCSLLNVRGSEGAAWAVAMCNAGQTQEAGKRSGGVLVPSSTILIPPQLQFSSSSPEPHSWGASRVLGRKTRCVEQWESFPLSSADVSIQGGNLQIPLMCCLFPRNTSSSLAESQQPQAEAAPSRPRPHCPASSERASPHRTSPSS